MYEARAYLESITYTSKLYNDSCDNANLRRSFGYDDETSSVSVADDVVAKLYPNPNNGSFMLTYNLKNYTEAVVQIMDVTGKLVFTTTIDNLENNKQLYTSNLSNGIYIIQLLSNKTLLWTDKLMIHK